MKRWVVISTAGSGYTQKYAPEMTFFKRYRDAEKYLRGIIKAWLKEQDYFDSIKEFLESTCITDFEIRGEHFFLEEVVFE